MPSVRTIGNFAFECCYELSDVECGEDLETIRMCAFHTCPKLKRLVLPLKDDMIEDDVLCDCPKLVTVDLVGGIHNTVASLHMESWRNQVSEEINRINQVLRDADDGDSDDEDEDDEDGNNPRTRVIQQWMSSVNQQLNHYKAEHHKILWEATTLLELALWKANLDDKGGLEREAIRTNRGSQKRARKEICVTSGASIVIKNVLPFLQLE